MTTSDWQPPDRDAARPPADPPDPGTAAANATGPAEGAGGVPAPQLTNPAQTAGPPPIPSPADPAYQPYSPYSGYQAGPAAATGFIGPQPTAVPPAGVDPPVPPLPTGPRKRPPSRLLIATLTVWVVLFILAATIPGVVFYRNTHDGSVDTVTTFLAALHRKDVTEALRIARPATKPDLTQQVFLAKDAMRTDWRVVSVKEAADPAPENDKDERLISVQIAAADGTTANGSIYLLADPNPPKGLPGWRIPTPWAQALVDAPRALSYLSINGKTFKGPLATTVYDFFPGVYATESLMPALVTVTDRPLIVANAGYAKATVASVPLTAELTPAAAYVYNTQMHTQLNLCARSTSRAPGNCPFQLIDPTTFNDGTVIGRFSGLHWKIDSFPTLGDPVRGPDGIFTVDTSTPGQATVAGEGVGISNGDSYTITVRCRLYPAYLLTPVPPNTLTVTPTLGGAAAGC